MSLHKILLVPALLALLSSLTAYSESEESGEGLGAESVKPFLGRWDLTLKAPDREYASWLEIRQEGGRLRAQMVGRWGNARPLPKIEFTNDRLIFVSPKEEEGRPNDMVFDGKLIGETLAGSTTGPDGIPWQWTGRRAPSLKRAHAKRQTICKR